MATKSRRILVQMGSLLAVAFVLFLVAFLAPGTGEGNGWLAAAQAVGAHTGQIVKTLLFLIDGQPVAGLRKMGALKKTTEAVDWRTGGDPTHVRKLPGGTKYEAITLEERRVAGSTRMVASVDAGLCMGCGLCASECPARAIQLNHFETDQFSVMIKTLFADMNNKQVTKAPVKAGK